MCLSAFAHWSRHNRSNIGHALVRTKPSFRPPAISFKRRASHGCSVSAIGCMWADGHVQLAKNAAIQTGKST